MRLRRCIVLGLAALVVLGASVAARPAGGVPAGELVMFETAYCPWCRLWHRDIGPIYPRSAEAARFALRRVDMTKPWPADLQQVTGVRFSPTFVVRLDGRELGRIIGYPGEDQFWGSLAAIVARPLHGKESTP